MWTLVPDPGTDPAGSVSEYWKIGAGALVSVGSKAHSEAVLTKVE